MYWGHFYFWPLSFSGLLFILLFLQISSYLFTYIFVFPKFLNFYYLYLNHVWIFSFYNNAIFKYSNITFLIVLNVKSVFPLLLDSLSLSFLQFLDFTICPVAFISFKQFDVLIDREHQAEIFTLLEGSQSYSRVIQYLCPICFPHSCPSGAP